jgi:hypothetical protein
MATVKDKIIKKILSIDDEDLLQEVYVLLNDIQNTKGILVLNSEQKENIDEGTKDYLEGRHQTTRDLFKEFI